MKESYEVILKLFGIKHPKIIFVVIPIIFVCIISLKYFEASFYKEKFKQYSETTNQNFKELIAHKNTIDKSGVYYELSDDYLRVNIGFTRRLITGYFDIPITSIVGCSQSWWGGSKYDTQLLLKENSKTLELSGINLKEWCWNNKIPYFSGKDMGEWMREQKPLPSVNSKVMQQRLASKEVYFSVDRSASCNK